MQDAYREALIQEDILPLTNADVEVVQAEEGKPLIFKATVPVRPEVDPRRLPRTSRSARRSRRIDDARVDQVVEELRDQNATLAAVEDRGAKDGDYAVISFVGTRDGEPFEGGTSDRMPLILGQERLIPGFEANLVGLEVGGDDRVRHHLPRGLRRAEPGRADRPLRGRPSRSCARRSCPSSTTTSWPASATSRRSTRCATDIRPRLEGNALDRARHGFADRIIEYAVANATVELPDVLIDQEVEVMHDEFRGSLARQGITEEAYLKAVEKTGDDLHADFRPERRARVKTLLVLSKVADAEGVEVPDADVEAEVEQGRERYAGDPKLTEYFESERGRVVHPQHAPPEPRRRDAHRPLAGRPSRASRRCRTSRTSPGRPSTTSRPRPTPRSAPPIRARSSPTTRSRSRRTSPTAGLMTARPTDRPRPDPTTDHTRETPDARPDGHRILQPR